MTQTISHEDLLDVYIAGERAGVLRQSANGSLAFSYAPDYAGIPLSLTMPLSNRVYGDKTVRPYLMGLLPDGSEVRRSLGRRFGVSGNNPFALLSHVGLDCPGAVQVCSPGAGLPQRENILEPLSIADIEKRLAQARVNSEVSWEAPNEHWSLGGQQQKFALRLEDGGWFSCKGAAATTHLLKPGIRGLRFEALNEYVCLRAAAECGIPTCNVEYRAFGAEPAIVVERYDRIRNKAGDVVRLHQEDLCQVLSVLPENKYPEEGGPGANDILRVLRGSGNAARLNIRMFVKMLFFNYLIGAPDAHAKNYSLLLDVRDAFLAPLYDVASAIPYAERIEDIKTAMGIAGENRVARMSNRRLARFADANDLGEYGLTGNELAQMLVELAMQVPKAFNRVFEDDAAIPGIAELRERMQPGLDFLCERSIARVTEEK